MKKISKTPAPVRADQNVGEAFATILRHNSEYLVQWEPAARSWEDIEGVHQVRVSFRRMRSALVAFRPAIPKSHTAYWADEMRWLAGQLGLARDLDVFIDEGLNVVRGRLPLEGGERLMGLAEEHRAKAYETVRAMLNGDRYARFKQAFPEWTAREGWMDDQLSAKHRKRIESNVVPFAQGLLDNLERNVLLTGSQVDRDSAPEMHRLRIQCKKLRYGAEFFSPLFNGMDEFIRHLKGLQDLLGVMNDVSVMQHLLEQLLVGEKDVAVLEYAGGLVGWRSRQYFEILDSFDERWDEFVHAKHPWWLKSALPGQGTSPT